MGLERQQGEGIIMPILVMTEKQIKRLRTDKRFRVVKLKPIIDAPIVSQKQIQKVLLIIEGKA